MLAVLIAAMDILVIGGTGHLGRDIVARLLAQNRSVRVFARRAGGEQSVTWALGDLVTGAGLAAALRGVDTVIHAATHSPMAQTGKIRPSDFFNSPTDVDIDGTTHVLAECERAGIRHLLFVSIVGLEGSSLAYSRVKLAGEMLVRQSHLPWSVVRATPFYYLLARMLERLRWLPVWLAPDTPVNPVDTSDVATYIGECVDDGKRGVREEIGGPQTLGFAEFARQFQQARGIRRPVIPIRISSQRAAKFGFAVAQGRRGTKTWAEFLADSR